MSVAIEAVVRRPTGLETFSDPELIRRYRNGDMPAMETLLARHSDALLSFCHTLLPRSHDAEDIHQETLVRAVSRIGKLRDAGAFKSWLYCIARNLANDAFRGQKRLCCLPEDDAMPATLCDEDPQIEVETREEYQLVHEALGKLAKRHQTVLILREVQGMSYDEIARNLDVSRTAVETLLFRARRSLRAEYGKTAGYPAPVRNGSTSALAA